MTAFNARNKETQPIAVALKNGHKPFFQAKLTINQPNDVYEQEADAMADKAMRMPAVDTGKPSFFKPANSMIARKCKHCEEEENLQRKEISAEGVQKNSQLDDYVASLGLSGQPLPENSRKFFEPRFGNDFSDVRIHTDSVAAKSAQSINALAYTSGNNIVFNSGQYAPESDNGKRLMAHELTHVVQQSSSVLPKLIQRDGPAGDPSQNDPTYRSPTYVQPGGPFDHNDNIFTLQWGPDGLKFGFPIPGAAPGADNAGFTVICPPGQRHVFKTGDCCPIGRYNQATDTCCDEGQIPGGSQCVDAGSTPSRSENPPIPPGNCDISQLNLLTHECCVLPMVPYLSQCVTPDVPPKPAPAQGLSGTFPAGVIDDFDIDAAALNSRQTAAYQSILSNLRLILHNCPATIITINGFTDAPGTPEHNMQLAQNRADSVKFRLQIDLLNPASVIQPFILAIGEGAANPVDTDAGQRYSARNRRVEVQMDMQCPPMRLTPP
jgi:outer membrane protein OmpA-like peptidoglycan-associated protein